MKSLTKHWIPWIHFNPIYRDLIVVAAMGLLVAFAIVTVGFILFH